MREEIPKRAVVIVYTLFGLGLFYYIYYKQFVVPMLLPSLQRFHDISFIILWCLVTLLVLLWYRRFTVSLEIEPDEITLIKRVGKKELSKDVLQRSEIVSLEPEGIKRAGNSMAFFYLHLASTTHPTKVLTMNSYKEMSHIVSEWNDQNYPFTFLKSLEDYKNEWKTQAIRFIILYFSFLGLLGALLYFFLSK